MIRKSVQRFSEKIMRKTARSKRDDEIIALKCDPATSPAGAPRLERDGIWDDRHRALVA